MTEVGISLSCVAVALLFAAGVRTRPLRAARFVCLTILGTVLGLPWWVLLALPIAGRISGA